MENAFDEMTKAVRAAHAVNRAVDDQTNSMLELIEGRLRGGNVSRYRLKWLKKELSKFNAITMKWDSE
jgi:DNA polymerase III epsilon subunit-like protein